MLDDGILAELCPGRRARDARIITCITTNDIPTILVSQCLSADTARATTDRMRVSERCTCSFCILAALRTGGTDAFSRSESHQLEMLDSRTASYTKETIQGILLKERQTLRKGITHALLDASRGPVCPTAYCLLLDVVVATQ